MYRFPEDLKKAYESSPLSFVYYQNIDDKPVPILVSDGFCRNTGMSRENILKWLSIGLFGRIHPDDVGMVSEISNEFLHKRGEYDIVFRCRLRDIDDDENSDLPNEKYVPIHGLGKWQTMPDGTELSVITYANISVTKSVAKNQMDTYILHRRDRFYTDPLTGLPNVNYLHEFGEERVNAIRADGKTPHVVYMNIYSMQSYNNQYGFEEGDRLLQLTAETLKEKFPKALIVRGADDRFILISWIDDKAELEQRLIKVNEIIRQTSSGNTSGIRTGICPIDTNVRLIEALDHAKHALKRIENDMNREVAFFSQAADDLYWKNRYIVESFDRALKNGWIKVFYHALYRIETQKVSAFEGLARWVDPNRGIIMPSEFIPVLLKYHQLYKLDLSIFDQVCRDVRTRYENGLPLVPVSVNFSMQDFDHTDIPKEMNQIYDKYGLDSYVDKSYFIVEITEQDMARGSDRLWEQLKKIHDSGYCLWLDDFGSGYSALNMFSRFDFDLIKYDMDLIRHLDDNGGANRLILKELVYMAKKLGVHTLVEGLETDEQVSFAKEIGCELAQGFCYHKPEPLEEILFKFKNGDYSMQKCETPQERNELNGKWFQ